MEWLFLGLRSAIIATPFVIAVLLPLFLFYGAWAFYHRPTAGVSSVIWVFVIETLIMIQPRLPLGVQLFLPDLLFLLIGVAGLLRIFSVHLQRHHYVWLLFGAVLMLSFVLGVLQYGTQAGVEFRTFFYFWAGIWYLMSFQLTAEQLDKILRVYMVAASVMVVLALFRWVAMALGLDIVHFWNEGGSSLRVFNAPQTFFLAQAFLIGLYAYLNKTGPIWWRASLPILFVCIVMLQHRTVWAVTLASVAIIFLLSGKIRSKAISTFVLAGVLGTVVLLPFVAGGKLDTVQQSLAHSVEEVGQKDSTMTWRVESWKTLIEQWAYGGPVVNMIGKPFGAGFSRYIQASQIELTQNPHNHYVYALLRVGLVGLLAMLAVYYMALRMMWKNRDQPSMHLLDPKLLIALVVGQLMFFISYPAHYSQLLALGLSLVLLGQYRREAVAFAPIKKA
jgi:O-antigen ligase